jgi:oxygen-independent coproporphyrinogen-3 oxidase
VWAITRGASAITSAATARRNLPVTGTRIRHPPEDGLARAALSRHFRLRNRSITLLLYLHIPFCHRICPYCSFYKHTPGTTPIGRFIDALAAEARTRIVAASELPRSVYLGGGTPSMLSPGHLERLFASLHEVFDFKRLDEVTLEANPATFDARKAALFRNLGVTRVSLGIQSFSPHVLQTLGREHNREQACESVAILREAGISQVNIDLMFSIPGQSKDDWQDSLRQAVALEPDHISAYNLTYEEDTAFFDSLKRGEVSPSEDIDAEFFYLADSYLGSCGFDHYETSNYAMPGCKSSHNQGYWRGEDYLGLGPSAVSTTAGIRTRNVADTAQYVSRIEALGNATDEAEVLDAEARRLERIALGLRTRDGIPLDLLDENGRARAADLVAGKLASIESGRLVLIHHGRALVDPIAAELV